MLQENLVAIWLDRKLEKEMKNIREYRKKEKRVLDFHFIITT